MDNDYPTIPLPKVSTPQPAPPAKKMFLKNEKVRQTFLIAVAGILVVAIATWFVIFALRAGRTPAQVVNDSADEMYHVQQEIALVSVPGETERYVLFYISEDALACALLSRGAGGYKLLNTLGHLSLNAAGKQGLWMATSIGENKKEFLVFGLVFDDSIKKVDIDGVPATLINTPEYRCWYYIGEGNMSINSESVAYK